MDSAISRTCHYPLTCNMNIDDMHLKEFPTAHMFIA